MLKANIIPYPKGYRVKIKVLGSSAGGGLPQWNCNCDNCDNSRMGVIPQKTQSSIAVLTDSGNTLINASPDIRQQINNYPFTRNHLRDNIFDDIILVDSQLDHTLGLLNIREGNSLNLHCTQIVKDQITHEFPIIPILESYCGTSYSEIVPNTSFVLNGAGYTPIDIISNSPPYSKYRHSTVYGSNIGLIINNPESGKKLFYAPGLGKITTGIEAIFGMVDHILIDGTCWTNDELINIGISASTASYMGHVSQDGPDGMLSILKKYPKLKKTLIHINNTNPILDPRSDNLRILQDNDISVSYDGMEILL
jgi:pyrroloquinoline quinone biosynthesis protein B